jgi:hypothetical protein
MNRPGEPPTYFSSNWIISMPNNDCSRRLTRITSSKDQLFDISNCRVETYLDGVMAECLTPQLRSSCGYSIPFANAYFCKHPKIVKSVL